MSERKFIFKGGSKELILPVTPDSYRIEKGVNVELVNIHEVGDAVFSGYGTLAVIQISCMFPAHGYAFARDDDPDRYIKQFSKWVTGKTKLRFIVSGTGINLPVKLQSFQYGERDGSNDVYADLVLREWRELKAPNSIVNKTSASSSYVRAPMEKPAESYSASQPVNKGETLQSITRNFFGTSAGQAVQKVAEASGLVGKTLFNVSTLNLRGAADAINKLKSL